MARGLDEQVAARVVDVSPRHVAEVRGGDARRVLGIPGWGGGGGDVEALGHRQPDEPLAAP